MADPITGIETDDVKRVTDFLGRQAPLSFAGQAPLPGVAPPLPSAGPSGPAGLGVQPSAETLEGTAKVAPPLPGDPSFQEGSSGGDGAGQGAGAAPGGGGINESAFGSPSGILGGVSTPSAFGVHGTMGPTGTLGVAFDNPTLNTMANVGKMGLNLGGIQTGLSLSQLGSLVAGPAVGGIIGSVLGPAGALLSAVQIAHALAGLSQETTRSGLESLTAGLRSGSETVRDSAQNALNAASAVAQGQLSQEAALANMTPAQINMFNSAMTASGILGYADSSRPSGYTYSSEMTVGVQGGGGYGRGTSSDQTFSQFAESISRALGFNPDPTAPGGPEGGTGIGAPGTGVDTSGLSPGTPDGSSPSPGGPAGPGPSSDGGGAGGGGAGTGGSGDASDAE